MIPWRGEDSRDGVRGEVADGFFSRRAAAAKNANQRRRLLALAAVLDGMNLTDAAPIGGMDRQTLPETECIGLTTMALTGFSTIGRRARCRASRPSSERNWRGLSRHVRTGPSIASCAGGASRNGGGTITPAVLTPVSAASRQTSLPRGANRIKRRTESSYDWGHFGGKVRAPEQRRKFEPSSKRRKRRPACSPGVTD